MHRYMSIFLHFRALLNRIPLKGLVVSVAVIYTAFGISLAQFVVASMVEGASGKINVNSSLGISSSTPFAKISVGSDSHHDDGKISHRRCDYCHRLAKWQPAEGYSWRKSHDHDDRLRRGADPPLRRLPGRHRLSHPHLARGPYSGRAEARPLSQRPRASATY